MVFWCGPAVAGLFCDLEVTGTTARVETEDVHLLSNEPAGHSSWARVNMVTGGHLQKNQSTEFREFLVDQPDT